MLEKPNIMFSKLKKIKKKLTEQARLPQARPEGLSLLAFTYYSY